LVGVLLCYLFCLFFGKDAGDESSLIQIMMSLIYLIDRRACDSNNSAAIYFPSLEFFLAARRDFLDIFFFDFHSNAKSNLVVIFIPILMTSIEPN
jgi:hypothetical protein